MCSERKRSNIWSNSTALLKKLFKNQSRRFESRRETKSTITANIFSEKKDGIIKARTRDNGSMWRAWMQK